jgi:hypothetical protein
LEKIKRQIGTSPKPVQPLAPPGRRALWLPVLWVLSVGFVLIAFGIRRDYQQLGPWATWGFALAQCLLAYLLAGTGLRLTIPGLNLSKLTLVLFVLVTVAFQFGVFAATFELSPVRVEPGRQWEMAMICLLVTIPLGLLPLAVMSALSVKGVPQRAVAIGLLCGLGGGLAAEAAWRLHCPYSAWGHVLTAHSGGVLALALLGAGLGYYWQRKRI